MGLEGLVPQRSGLECINVNDFDRNIAIRWRGKEFQLGLVLEMCRST